MSASAAGAASPQVVTVKLLKPDSSGRMQRVFLEYASPGASSAVEDCTLFRDEFNGLLAALMGALPPDAVAATEVLFQVRPERACAGTATGGCCRAAADSCFPRARDAHTQIPLLLRPAPRPTPASPRAPPALLPSGRLNSPAV
jgi:hypothetical protein